MCSCKSTLGDDKGIEIIPDIKFDTLHTGIDEAKINQVLNNLLSNAIKFSEMNTEG